MFFRALLILLLVLVGLINVHAQGIEYHKDEQLEKKQRVRKFDNVFRKGFILTPIGVTLLAGGATLIAKGALLVKNHEGNIFDTNDAYPPGENRMHSIGVGLLVISPIMVIPGIVLTAMGVYNLGRGHILKNNTEVSYSPYISPCTNSFGMNVSVRF